MKLSPLQINPALLSGGNTVQTPPVSKEMAKIEQTAREFESMFLSEMLKPIFDSVPVNEIFGGGKTEEIFGGFLRDEYSKMLAGTGTIGIAELVKEELIEMQSRAAKEKLAQNVQRKITDSHGENYV